MKHQLPVVSQWLKDEPKPEQRSGRSHTLQLRQRRWAAPAPTPLSACTTLSRCTHPGAEDTRRHYTWTRLQLASGPASPQPCCRRKQESGLHQEQNLGHECMEPSWGQVKEVQWRGSFHQKHERSPRDARSWAQTGTVIKNMNVWPMWLCTPVIPAIWEVAVEESRSPASPGKSGRPYLKTKLKAKGLGCGPPVPPKPKNERDFSITRSSAH